LIKNQWPDDKKFAFTIVDDTDCATVENVKPVYDYLYERGFLTTKTVWVYPSEDKFTGECLMDKYYLDFIKGIQLFGFEIALHNTCSGAIEREKIIEGFEQFKTFLGKYPKIHINHANNMENIYWGGMRFCKPVRYVYNKVQKTYRPQGHNPDSLFFWGDICKEKVTYIRNRVFTGINTLKYDPMMPYYEKEKIKYSNYWFSSSDGCDVQRFIKLLSKQNVDRLEKERGCCIVYTHFGKQFVTETGLNNDFKICMDYLALKNGLFLPASDLLDILRERKNKNIAPPLYLSSLDFKWIIERFLRKY